MIAVLGAGAVGGFIGGMLAAAGAPVSLIGRERTQAALSGGLTALPLSGEPRDAGPEAALVRGAADGLAGADVVLLCMKAAQTDEAIRLIARHAPRGALVVTLQNGLGSYERLAEALGPDRVTAGVVGFNVVRPRPDTFRQTTAGAIHLAPKAGTLAAQFRAAGLPTQVSCNMEGIRWSKLMLNLANPLNALSGLPLREQLLDRDWRRLHTACVREALAVAAAKGVRLERLGRVHPKLLPLLLPLPTPAFRHLASAMLRVDPEARTSMAQDLSNGSRPELNWLNGAVVAEGARLGLSSPVNAAVTERCRAAFEAGRAPDWTGAEARKELLGARRA